MTLQGKINASQLSTRPIVTGQMQLLPFNLKETLTAIGQDVPNLQTAQMVKGDMNFTADMEGVKAESNLNIDTLQAAKVMMSNVNVKAHFQKGILDAPLSANLYQGTLSGQAIVRFGMLQRLKLSLHAKLSNVQAMPLMEDLGGKDQKIKVSGVGNIEMQVTTSGTESKTILQNLNGVSQFNFKDGSIIGVDVGYLIDSGYALLKREPMTASNTNQTNFGMLSGTAVIRSGVINNNDLLADTPRFAIRGTGTINLVAQKIDYSLQTAIKKRSDQKDNMMNLYGITLPVLITGNLNNPTIRLDSTVLAKAIATQQINKVTNQAKEKLQEQIKKQLPGKAGELLNGKAGDVLNNLLGQ